MSAYNITFSQSNQTVVTYFTTLFIIFNDIDCGYLLEPPQGSNTTHNLCFKPK